MNGQNINLMAAARLKYFFNWFIYLGDLIMTINAHIILVAPVWSHSEFFFYRDKFCVTFLECSPYKK